MRFKGGIPGEQTPALKSWADEYHPLSSMSTWEKKQAFGMWLGIVYVNRTPPPPRPSGGISVMEDPITVFDFHNDYEAGAWKKLDDGLTLEEMYLMSELMIGDPFVCVLSPLASELASARIEHKVELDAQKAVEVALDYFRQHQGKRRHPIGALVACSESFGHCITLSDADPTGSLVAYHDPWPGRSVLCEENNSMVAALPIGTTKLHYPDGKSYDMDLWQLSVEELAKILVALMMPKTLWDALPQ
jgi:hypothetical protein